MSLTVAKFQARTKVLGPGIRAVVWFHGCTRHCPHCIAAGMNHSEDFETIAAEQLAERVLQLDDIEGITLSGGEPFQQNAVDLLAFVQAVKAKSNLSIMVYTGYLIDELKSRPETAKILQFLDLLVDAPYIHEQNDDSVWRGSANQTIHFLSERYMALREEILHRKGREMEIRLGLDGTLDLTGIPSKKFVENLDKALNAKQMSITW